jgi:hypothetical protein
MSFGTSGHNLRLLLIDVCYAFNKLNQMVMLWIIPQGDHYPVLGFQFNCYQHQVILVIQNKGGGAALFVLLGHEGVTKGNPLTIMEFAIGVIPLIQCLKGEFPCMKQPWYMVVHQ